MRARPLRPLHASALSAVALALPLPPAGAGAAANLPEGAPAACSGVHITDAVGDGHHNNTDITAAWLSSPAGRLQATLVVRNGEWKPAHDDSTSAGWAVLWQYSGATRYVRMAATQGGSLSYDAGEWTRARGFVSSGPTTGAVSAAGPDGWITIDVPAASGAETAAVLSSPFALTYDGVEAGDLHWVDRAPGGTTPDATDVGADAVVAPCQSVAPIDAAPSGPTSVSLPPLIAIDLRAPERVTGARSAQRITGTVTPARAGVTVAVTKTTPSRTITRTVTTDAAGRYALRTPISERTQLRAVALGLGSQTHTVEVTARVRIAVRRTRRGGAVITGTVSPRLPGRVLWLRRDAVLPSATTRPDARGRFTFRLDRPGRGRYQALFLPANDRALRALSNTGVIR